ncbi:MAG TPA: transposase [Acidobacteriota bacterium]|jgi:REP element-mobilizing transposase RayT
MAASNSGIRNESASPCDGLSKKAIKLRCWKVRFRGVDRTISREIFFEKLISCFSRHERNLYDSPEFVLCDLTRYGDSIELLVRARSKQSVLQRISRLKISCRQIRCRLFDPAGVSSAPNFSGWLVNQYGLASSDPGRRAVRIGQRRPIGNNHLLHICSRCVQQRFLFGESEKDMIFQILERICQELPFQLHAFVIMDNHFHLVITTKQDVSVSRLMKSIKQAISKQFNRLHGTKGTLWEGRFKSIVWEPTPENILRLVDYVHANPLRANMVSDPEQYRWSSYSHYVGTKRRKMLVVPLALKRRHPKRLEREAWYKRHFLEKYREGDLAYDPEFSSGLVRGSKKFCKSIVRELATLLRIPALLTQAIKLKREGCLWGLKALLHVLCKPAVDAWHEAMKCWQMPPSQVPTGAST